MVGQVVSPFDLSQTLLVGGGLLVRCSLPGPPAVKQLMRIVTMVPGQGGWFQCASPNSFTTGGPGKEQGTNKPPPTRRVQKGQKETPPARPPPRILLSGIHLG